MLVVAAEADEPIRSGGRPHVLAEPVSTSTVRGCMADSSLMGDGGFADKTGMGHSGEGKLL